MRSSNAAKRKADHNGRLMERATGVEPASEAWEASILPMNYARMVVAKSESSTATGIAHLGEGQILLRFRKTSQPHSQATSAFRNLSLSQSHHSELPEASDAEPDEAYAEALEAAAEAEALAEALASSVEYSRKISAELESPPSGR